MYGEVLSNQESWRFRDSAGKAHTLSGVWKQINSENYNPGLLQDIISCHVMS